MVNKNYLVVLAGSPRGGEKTWESEIDGCKWTQQTFPYQAKCLKWINEEFQSLSETDQARVKKLINETGCEFLIKN